MAREANQSNQWKYNVKQIKLLTPEGEFSGFFGNQREDTKEVLGTTSEQYGLVQNSALMEVAHTALQRRGLTDFKEKVIVTGGGQRVFMEFSFENKQLKSDVGDVFGYKLVMKNSFDRTLRASLELGFMRLICKNGMATLEKEFSATKKHSTLITVDFVGEAVDNALERGPEALKIFGQLANVSLTHEQGLFVLANFQERNLLSGKVKESVAAIWNAPKYAEDKARNLYSLYNAVTQHLTHDVENERYEYANKTNGTVLLTLVNAARKGGDTLKKLLLPLPQNKQTTIVASGPIIDV